MKKEERKGGEAKRGDGVRTVSREALKKRRKRGVWGRKRESHPSLSGIILRRVRGRATDYHRRRRRRRRQTLSFCSRGWKLISALFFPLLKPLADPRSPWLSVMGERDGQRRKWKLINDENGGVGLSARTCSGFQIEISRFRDRRS